MSALSVVLIFTSASLSDSCGVLLCESLKKNCERNLLVLLCSDQFYSDWFGFRRAGWHDFDYWLTQCSQFSSDRSGPSS